MNTSEQIKKIEKAIDKINSLQSEISDLSEIFSNEDLKQKCEDSAFEIGLGKDILEILLRKLQK